MAAPVLSPFAARAYQLVAPIATEDEANAWALAIYIAALSEPFNEIDELASDGPDGQPGWYKLMDPNLIPDKGLPWLAQFLGVDLTGVTDPADMRYLIATRPSWNRGTTRAMIDAVAPLLTGNKTVIFRERYPTPYQLSVVTRTAETPDSAAVLKALLSQKPAGIVLTYTVLSGQDYQSVFTDHASYNIVYTTYATYQDLLDDNASGPPSTEGLTYNGAGTWNSGTYNGS